MSSFDRIISIFLSSSHFILFSSDLSYYLHLTHWILQLQNLVLFYNFTLFSKGLFLFINFIPKFIELPSCVFFFFFCSSMIFFTPVLNSLPLRLKYYFSLCNTTFPWFFIVFDTCTSFTFEVADTYPSQEFILTLLLSVVFKSSNFHCVPDI